MSLGYSSFRKHQQPTNLIGSVGANTVAVRGTRHAPPSQQRLLLSKRRTQLEANADDAPKNVQKQVANRRTPEANTDDVPKNVQKQADAVNGMEEHFIYATVATKLHDAASGELVANKGERVFLVYPMLQHDTGEEVHMRLKQADPGTGQLSYRWVKVHDCSSDHILSNYSLTP